MPKVFFVGFFLLFLLQPPIAAAQEPNDPEYDQEWHLEKIHAPEAWESSTGSQDIVVAVLDVGIDLDHPDLQANLWTNGYEIPDNGIDDDQNGFADDVHGWDFVRRDNDPSPDTTDRASDEAVTHGSIVAGILGAVGNNSVGVSGVNWDVTIMPVRMLDDIGSGTSFQAAAAVEYAIANGADVINLSFAGSTEELPLRGAIQHAYESGIVVVAALGNEGQNTKNFPVYPACYEGDDDWVIGVVSSSADDQRSTFSNFGDCADIAAPGEFIYSTLYYDPSEGFDEEYAGDASGTSMASPVVAGAAALLLDAYPDLTPDEVRKALKLSVDPLNGPLANQSGAGRLNLARAVEYAAAYSDAGVEEITEEPVEADSLGEGDVFTSPSYTTVYVLDDDDRRAFINESTYFTYFDSFNEIETVQDSDLANFSLSDLVLPKAGVVLVKIQSDPRVYALAENEDDPYKPLLREIMSEEIAEEMYGENWADYVIDVEPTFFSHFGHGDVIEEAETVDSSIMKTREELAALAL